MTGPATTPMIADPICAAMTALAKTARMMTAAQNRAAMISAAITATRTAAIMATGWLAWAIMCQISSCAALLLPQPPPMMLKRPLPPEPTADIATPGGLNCADGSKPKGPRNCEALFAFHCRHQSSASLLITTVTSGFLPISSIATCRTIRRNASVSLSSFDNSFLPDPSR